MNSKSSYWDHLAIEVVTLKCISFQLDFQQNRKMSHLAIAKYSDYIAILCKTTFKEFFFYELKHYDVENDDSPVFQKDSRVTEF